jgi:hypothetical protein
LGLCKRSLIWLIGQKFESPTVIVVGEVVRLGWELHWVNKTEFDYQSESTKVQENSAELKI